MKEDAIEHNEAINILRITAMDQLVLLNLDGFGIVVDLLAGDRGLPVRVSQGRPRCLVSGEGGSQNQVITEKYQINTWNNKLHPVRLYSEICPWTWTLVSKETIRIAIIKIQKSKWEIVEIVSTFLTIVISLPTYHKLSR